jgi:hypothetical protein
MDISVTAGKALASAAENSKASGRQLQCIAQLSLGGRRRRK